MSNIEIKHEGCLYEYVIMANDSIVCYKKPDEQMVIVDAQLAILVLLKRIKSLESENERTT